ncbi:MAG: FecR domain-containing protein, partial [Variovorax sp.]|nr:FecR domain-containing protein [Variovorax sp.]
AGRGLMPTDVETVRYIAQREVREITLPDGSTMTLDAQSVALARFGNDTRSLELERGRALFSVRHDPSRPFAVDAGSRRVIALGTEFEVDRAPSRLTVTLFKGRVAIEPVANGATVTLAPGERFVEANGRPVVQRFAAGIAPGSWREGLLEFDDRPLADAVAEANRYSAEQLVVRDPAVGAMRISGQFRAGDAERFARTLAEIYPLRMVRREDEIELAPAR